jgi:hypothetical protein
MVHAGGDLLGYGARQFYEARALFVLLGSTQPEGRKMVHHLWIAADYKYKSRRKEVD